MSVICTAEGDKASYCSSMSARDCYVLADTCCQTCQQAYVPANGKLLHIRPISYRSYVI